MNEISESPQFEHDCDRDVFLGTFEGHDLYFADHGGMGLEGYEPRPSTVIARYGDDGPQYISGFPFAKINPAIAEALKRSVDHGHLKRVKEEKTPLA